MISMSMELIGESVVASRLFLLKETTEAKLVGALSRVGARGAEAISALAPVETGAYAGSISAGPVESVGDGWYVRVGTGKPQGRRLELDYSGPDIRGRRYDHTSLPHPHFAPVFPLLQGWLTEELRS